MARISGIRVAACAVAIAIISTAAWAGKSFVMPEARPAATYPAHDAHTDEGVTVALDPYDTSEKANIFRIKYGELGFLPVLLIVTNDSDQPISLTGMKAELVTADRTKIGAADQDELYRRVSRPSASNRPSPLPIPTRKVKGGVTTPEIEEMQNARFAAKAIEPHTTHAGFLFFDVSGISSPMAGATVYLTGVNNSKGDELLYFEIPLEKYLNAKP